MPVLVCHDEIVVECDAEQAWREAWREGNHDGPVLAVALSCWVGAILEEVQAGEGLQLLQRPS